jgi:hypothetical protein
MTALKHIEGGKQGGRAVSFVVMGHMVPQRPFFIGNPSCDLLQSLNLLFSSTHETNGLMVRIQVQAHDIFKLFDERFIRESLKVRFR